MGIELGLRCMRPLVDEGSILKIFAVKIGIRNKSSNCLLFAANQRTIQR